MGILASELELHSDTRHLATFLACQYLTSLTYTDRLKVIEEVAKSATILSAKLREGEFELSSRIGLIQSITYSPLPTQMDHRNNPNSPQPICKIAPFEIKISSYFGWNFCILTVHDYILRFAHIGLLLGSDKITIGSSDNHTLPTRNDLNNMSDRQPHVPNNLKDTEFYQSISVEYAYLPFERSQSYVKDLDNSYIIDLAFQLESDCLAMCEQVGDFMLTNKAKHQRIAFYLVLLARSMARISPDK